MIGPSKATYPAVLNPFLFDGAQYVASGRVTAMALSPSCRPGNCALYVAARRRRRVEGQGHARRKPNWQFVSGSFATNAIGSLLMDKNDATGNTLYAGTGEPNASGDSEAGVGIYKTTDGGETWALVAGSDIFFQRAIGQMALDGAGNLLVPIASAVRGISSVTSGASSSAATGHPLATRGLYRQNGSLFTLIRPIVAPATTARGSTTVQVDPTHAGVLYSQRVLARRLAVSRQRRDVDADQDAAQRDPQHRPRRICDHDAAERQDAHVCRRRQPERCGCEPGARLSH